MAFAVYLLVAEVLAVFGAAVDVALERHSRNDLLDLAERRGQRDKVEARLDRLPVYELTARLARFLGNALVVIGIAFLAFKDRLSGGGTESGTTTLPWATLGVVMLVTFVLTFLVNDVLVRLLANRRPTRFLMAALPYLEGLRFASAPLRLPLVWFVRLVFRVRLDAAAPSAREEILETVEEGEREGSFTTAEAEMIESIIDMDATCVKDVLTPRADMVTVRADASLDEAVTLVNEEGYSRIPVYGRDRDDVIGVLYARDLLAHWGAQCADDGAAARGVRDIMRKPFFVPETKPLSALLNEMRASKIHLAVVLDEFNGTAGVVTIEDLLEEIVGEIQDEYDEDEEAEKPLPRELADGGWHVEGRTAIEDVNARLGMDLPEEDDFETVGGLVFHRLGKVPAAGDRLDLGTVTLTVLEADERTVKRLKMDRRSRVPETPAAPTETP